jgi:hypothetical protein
MINSGGQARRAPHLCRDPRRSHRAAGRRRGGPRHAAALPSLRRQAARRVLRPLGDGAKRSLVCSLCATEWEYRRIVCPACGEESVDKLPAYVAEGAEQGFDHIRVEACDTCPPLHQDDRPDEKRQSRVGGGRIDGDSPQPMGGGERVHEVSANRLGL